MNTKSSKPIFSSFRYFSLPIGAKSIILVLIVGGVALFLGCALQQDARIPLHKEQGKPGRDLGKEALIKRLIQNEDRVRGIKAIQIVRVIDQRNGQVLDAQGLLALERPDRYRLRLFSSLGLTLLEFVLSNGEFRFRMPSKGIDISGKKDEAGEKIPYFPVEALREAFVHSYEADRIEWRQLDQTYLLTLHRKGDLSLVRRWIDREELTLVKEVFINNKEEELVIDYGQYRRHVEGKGLLLPYRIDIHLPQEGVRLEIKAIQYEINPTFHEKMFDLSLGGLYRYDRILNIRAAINRR